MEVNMTLLVQAINFGIAYIMIKKLLLVPVLALIKKHDDHRELVETTIAQLQEDIDGAKRSRQHLWERVRYYFATKGPDLSRHDLYVFKGIAPDVSVLEIDVDKKELVGNAKDALVKTIVGK